MKLSLSFMYVVVENTMRRVAMIIQKSLKSMTTNIDSHGICVKYNLFFQNALYSLECYKDGCLDKSPINYCFAENISEDEGEAEMFFYSMVKGKVLPIHIKDMVKDFF